MDPFRTISQAIYIILSEGKQILQLPSRKYFLDLLWW